MVTLYHAPQSRSSRFLWLLEELEAPYTVEYVDIKRRTGVGGPDPRNPHPDGKVPALVHDGHLVTESAAIALYLTDLFPVRGVGRGVGDPQRGEYLTWLAYYAGVVEPALVGREANKEEAEKVDRRVIGTLEKQPYLLGDGFSAADVLIASIMHFSRALFPASRALDEFLARVGARPAFTRSLAKDAKPA